MILCIAVIFLFVISPIQLLDHILDRPAGRRGGRRARFVEAKEIDIPVADAVLVVVAAAEAVGERLFLSVFLLFGPRWGVWVGHFCTSVNCIRCAVLEYEHCAFSLFKSDDLALKPVYSLTQLFDSHIGLPGLEQDILIGPNQLPLRTSGVAIPCLCDDVLFPQWLQIVP
jgi:hypothetical protein